MQSYNYPNHKFGVTSITDESPASIMHKGRRFVIHQPGLNGQNQTVSFESSDWPGHYLRHRGNFLYLDLKTEVTFGFEDTATFKLHKDLMHPGYFTFEVLDQPGFYIRHSGYKLRVDRSDSSNLFKADSSFRFLQGPYLMESENFKDHVIGVDQSNNAYIKDQYNQGLKLNFVHPGLTGVPGTVSLESDEKPGHYLRHYGYTVDLEERSHPRNPNMFDQDASFKLCTKGCFIDGYVTLEAGNLPNYYLRHSNYRVMMSAAEDRELFKRDASFKFINGKLLSNTRQKITNSAKKDHRKSSLHDPSVKALIPEKSKVSKMLIPEPMNTIPLHFHAVPKPSTFSFIRNICKW